jgi:uncharacterized protein YgiB involved in biofilm formation
MKHSKQIKLVLLGAVAAISLTACDDDDTPKEGQPIYETVEQCMAAGGVDCDAKYSRAFGNHIANGPRYQNQDQCLSNGHERCTNVSTGVAEIWLPAMVGFMVARSLENSRPVYLQGYPSPETDREREDRRVVAGSGNRGGGAVFIGSYNGGGGSYVPGTLSTSMSRGAARAGVAVAPPASVPGRAAVAAPSAAARGGFGASGHGMSAGG